MILVDGSSVLNRVLKTPQGDLTDNLGRPTGGVQGFLGSVASVVNKYQQNDLVVIAWDLGIPLFRRELYSEYKTHKIPIGDVLEIYKSEKNLLGKQGDEAPSAFLDKYVVSRRILHNKLFPKMGCFSIRVENCEADDIIAYFCEKITDEQIIIVSSDRDLLQLLNEDRIFYDSRTGSSEILSVQDVIQKYKLIPEDWRQHWLMARAIAGDSSDGIPSVGGIGLPTAIRYAQQIVGPYGNLYLSEALSKLIRVPGGRETGYDALVRGETEIIRNLTLMDLSYPIKMKLPIVNDIKTQIAQSFVNELDQYQVNVELHEMNLVRAKSYAGVIMESNSRYDIKSYIQRLI